MPLAMTIGIVEVADLAASAAVTPPAATITSTLRRTRSAAISLIFSPCRFAQRNSIATFRPSTYPASARPRRKEFTAPRLTDSEARLRYPTRGTLGRCAWAFSGQHIALLAPARNLRRVVWDIDFSRLVRPEEIWLRMWFFP